MSLHRLLLNALCVLVLSLGSTSVLASPSVTLEKYISLHCKKNCVDADRLARAVVQNATRIKATPKLLIAMIRKESTFNPRAKNGSSVGLMQVHLRWHKPKFMNTDYEDVEENLRVGSDILAACRAKTKYKLDAALECYNGGGDPNYVSSVRKILKSLAHVSIVVPRSTFPTHHLESESHMQNSLNNLKARVYGAGGAATNILSEFIKAAGQPSPGFAMMDLAFIDTSLSNARGNTQDKFYKIDGVSAVIDGAGKDRSAHHPVISASIPDFLHQHPPGDLNIVVHSAGGGSGSVAGPVLVSELLARGKTVVILTVGSTTCEKEITNTIGTLQSYQSISALRKVPVPVMYFENSAEMPMNTVDSRVRLNILMLLALWSGENTGLDTRDLENFLNYQRVTGHEPSVAAVRIFSKDQDHKPGKNQSVSSMVTLVEPDGDPSPGMLVGYHSFGCVSDAAKKAIDVAFPIHFQTVQGYFGEIMHRLNALNQEAKELYRVNKYAGIQVDGLAQADGLIL